MTTSQITWHKPTNHPDADIRVLIGLNVDGIRDSCEGYFGCNPDGRESWYTVAGGAMWAYLIQPRKAA